MAKVKELRGHTSRALHMALSPDGATVCSGGADETLCFWSVFGTNTDAKGRSKRDRVFANPGAGLSSSVSLQIR